MLASDIFAASLASDRPTQELLSACKITFSDNQLTIECCESSILQQVRGKMEEVNRRAIALSIPTILLTLNGEIYHRIDTRLLSLWSRMNIPLLTALPISSGDSICVIRMSDHKGLFATDNLCQGDRVSPNDWTGESVRRFNIPEFFRPYQESLIQHQHLSEYQLICLDGADNRQRQTINAWLTHWRGDLVRVVQVLHKEYL